MSLPENNADGNDRDLPSIAHTKQSILYTLLTAIPVLGDAVRITNAYVYSGDFDSDLRLAPIRFWFSRLWMNIVAAALLTLIPAHELVLDRKYTNLFPTLRIAEKLPEPGELLTSILPNILGFGLGVYALIFSLSPALLNSINRQMSRKKKENPSFKGSYLLLNADMAYPLLVMTISLGLGVLQKVLEPTPTFIVVAWFALWYSGLMVLEVLMAIFGLGENELIGKIDDKT